MDLPAQKSAQPRAELRVELCKILRPRVFGLDGQRWVEWPLGSMPVARALKELARTKGNSVFWLRDGVWPSV